jgi:hypothetical protein
VEPETASLETIYTESNPSPQKRTPLPMIALDEGPTTGYTSVPIFTAAVTAPSVGGGMSCEGGSSARLGNKGIQKRMK